MKKQKKTPESNGAPDLEAMLETEPPPGMMTGAELKKAFAAYDVANTKVDKVRAELEKLLNERSAVVEQIATAAGRGPYSYKGTVLTPVCRTAKSTGQKTWFFKGPGVKDLVEV